MSCLQKFINSIISQGGRATVMIITVAVCFLTGWQIPETKAAKPQEKEFTIVLDAGHGGHDHGAIDNGAREKDINLGVTLKLAELIKKKLKNVKVVLTRGEDRFISLQERANIANRNRGDLFVSIHTNSVDKSNPNRNKIAGASVYALGTQKNADNLRVARRENAVIELERDYHQKYSGFDPSKDESYIIFEMAQKKTIGQSLKFADAAQKQLVKAGRGDRGVRQAGFWVLWATSMPSVLVELDFICNPESAAYLNSKRGQEDLAEALFKAVDQYIEAQRKLQKNSTAFQEGKSTDAANVVLQQTNSGQINYAEENGDAESKVGMLAAANTEKKVRSHNPDTPQRSPYSNGPRKRRSASAREASDKRVLETENILVKNENDYMLVAEKQKEEITPAPQPKDDNNKGKKGKKKKEKAPKAKKQNNSNKTSNKEKSNSRSNQTTFVVKSSGNNTASNNPYDFYPSPAKSTKKEAKSSGVTTKNNTVKTQNPTAAISSARQGKMLYKILLLSSDTELKTNDPKFQGIVPTGMFVENGQYKYTFGASESRSDIESQLLGLRSILPEATIVVRME